MTIQHSVLTGAELHEPKGIDSATVNQLYLSDGAGTGAWTDVDGVLTAINQNFETGTWTPAFTFNTPGDLAVTYSIQEGQYSTMGSLVIASFTLGTTSFTHTTAAGQMRITGLPFTVGADTIDVTPLGFMYWSGITKANYTQLSPAAINSTTEALIRASGSGQVLASLAVADAPTGGTLSWRGTIIYYRDL